MNRNELRAALRRQRRSLEPIEQQTAKSALATIIYALPEFQQSQHIAAYLANDGEIDPADVVQEAWSLGKCCYLPVLDTQDTTNMFFVKYGPETPLAQNRYGIYEPALNKADICMPENLDLVLMPLTGFDEMGGRLGMGGGYYDRAFAFIKEKGLSKPALIGLAHECQKVTQIPVESWDIPMVGIATDTRYYQS